jgi:hypothetical protein
MVGANVIRKLVHGVERFRIVVVFGNEPRLAAHESAHDIVLVRGVEPESLGDVVCRFLPFCCGDPMAFQRDAIHAIFLPSLKHFIQQIAFGEG